jgi:hypothetical protein
VYVEEPPWWSVPLIYCRDLVVFGAICFILDTLWDEYVFLGFDNLRNPNASILEGLGRVWFIFAWAVIGTLVIGIVRRNEPHYDEPWPMLKNGVWVSLNAGIFEELIFRWLVFLNAMVGVVFVNWLTFGLLGWFYREVLIPLADFFTFGALEPQLMSGNWVLGAAIVSASITFRDQHAYLGWTGWINAWFVGMVMFWLVFNYGIGTAIVAHVLYDVLIFSTAAVTYTWRPGPGFDLAFGRRQD